MLTYRYCETMWNPFQYIERQIQQMLLSQQQILIVLNELVLATVQDTAKVQSLTQQIKITTQQLQTAIGFVSKDSKLGELKMATGVPSIDDLVAAVAAEDAVVASAITLINGIATMISNAVAAAIANGATAAQLSALTAVTTDVQAQAAALAAAVAANTPAKGRK